MTPPVKPEVIDPNPPSPSPKTDPPPSPTKEVEPPTPAASPFAGLSEEQKDKMLSFYMGAARGQEEKIKGLEERLGKVEKPAVEVNVGEQNKRFYERPFETTQEIVKREIKEAVAPLTEFVGAFKVNSELTRMKDELKVSNPKIAQVLQLGEGHVDRLVSEATQKGAPLTRELLMGAIASVKGGLDMGWLDGGSAPPAPSAPAPAGSGSPSPNIPPHLRPSAPPAPAPGTPKKLRELSEEERRLARENKMSEEEYLLALDMPAGAVTNPDAWKTGAKK